MKTSALNLRTSILAALTLILSFGVSFANPAGDEDKSTNKLMDQVIEYVEQPALEKDLDGKAVITIRVNEDNRIEVVEVFATSPLLVEQIETSLDGKEVKDYDLEYNQKIRFNMTYNDPEPGVSNQIQGMILED